MAGTPRASHLAAQERVRATVAGLVLAAGGQVAFGRAIGISQPTVQRYLAGGRLTVFVARRLHRAYPGLRPLIAQAVVAQVIDGVPATDDEPTEVA